MGVRRKRIALTEAMEFLEPLHSLPIRVCDPLSYDAVFDLAQAHSLTIYDAAYLDLAQRERLPLASLDDALCKAARSSGISLLTLSGNV
jgi:predicted nucleic acid-binding protein